MKKLDFQAIRARDKDCCHWCGQSVDFTRRNGRKTGRYDFIDNSKKPRATEANTVVSCRECASKNRGTQLPLSSTPKTVILNLPFRRNLNRKYLNPSAIPGKQIASLGKEKAQTLIQSACQFLSNTQVFPRTNSFLRNLTVSNRKGSTDRKYMRLRTAHMDSQEMPGVTSCVCRQNGNQLFSDKVAGFDAHWLARRVERNQARHRGIRSASRPNF